MPQVDNFEMWLTLLATTIVIAGYATERVPAELTSLCALGGLMLMFQISALIQGTEPTLGPTDILDGFSSPALIAVCALLVVGQAMINTGALENTARLLFWASRANFFRARTLSLSAVCGMSGLLNNTPIVVIFIPILRAVTDRFNQAPSRLLMPLSFAAILGGMLTLIGTSTNLLVSAQFSELGHAPFGFFDLTAPGLVLAGVGLIYLTFVTTLLPERDQRPGFPNGEGKQFIAELDVLPGSPLIGESARGGLFPSLRGVTVRLIQRSESNILPPFEDVVLQEGDVMIVAATRKVLTELLSRFPGHLLRSPGTAGKRSELVVAEAMIKPASRMIGQTIEFTNFAQRSQCTVLGIQRRARMLRTRLSDLRLEAGDVLLVIGREDDLEQLRADIDVLPMEWSASAMPQVGRGRVATAIFAAVVLPAALDLLPIVVSAVAGAAALILTGCINVRQAARAVDRQIVLVIVAALGLGAALEATGGAAFVAMGGLALFEGASPATILSALFLLVALATNILTNNATAVLFTPVAINVADGLGADPFPFAIAVALGASCSFATPIAYQTNLLVMGPGQYRFGDFTKFGTPLIFILWVAFTLFAPTYYGI